MSLSRYSAQLINDADTSRAKDAPGTRPLPLTTCFHLANVQEEQPISLNMSKGIRHRHRLHFICLLVKTATNFAEHIRADYFSHEAATEQ